MYEKYWGLCRRPFNDHADPEDFIKTDTHHAAVLKLRYLIENRLGLGVLTGDVGTGKSMVTTVLERDLPIENRPIVSIVYPRLNATEMLSYIACEFGGEPLAEASRAIGVDEIVRHLHQQLLAHGEAGRSPVILVDEAHLIEDPDVLQSLRLLLNFRRPPRVDFTILLCGDLTLLPQLQRIAALDDRIAVKCVLQSLAIHDTEDYVARRLQIAGATRTIFDEPATRAIHELSGGVPRRINRLCDLALLVGYADSLPRIGEAEIEAVAEELISAVPN